MVISGGTCRACCNVDINGADEEWKTKYRQTDHQCAADWCKGCHLVFEIFEARVRALALRVHDKGAARE